jgi:hypothetical protein
MSSLALSWLGHWYVRFSREVAPKRLELAHQLVTSAAVIGLLINPQSYRRDRDTRPGGGGHSPRSTIQGIPREYRSGDRSYVEGAVLFAVVLVVWTAFIGGPSQRQTFCRDRLMRRSISRERKSPARFR